MSTFSKYEHWSQTENLCRLSIIYITIHLGQTHCKVCPKCTVFMEKLYPALSIGRNDIDSMVISRVQMMHNVK